ncbi:hypothetical protein PCANC_06606 [Puccinia coronata f. sp. avenae]|uniref:Uncharacterized protein n=1 Tax=Puccinia coronata f. sp. avenae TaxID=200324 RepID=A0A2N5VA92_9BASI|nr:hypothetical protein PCANC_06606 [Puccinia coronata f. sp. avenae]
MYSRGWTPTEDEYIKEAIDKIKVGHPEVKGHMPFTHLPKLLDKRNETLYPTGSSQKELVKLTSKKTEPSPKKTVIKLKLNKPLANQLASPITQKTEAPSAPCCSGNSSDVKLKDTQPLVPVKSRDNETVVPTTDDSKTKNDTKTKAPVGRHRRSTRKASGSVSS